MTVAEKDWVLNLPEEMKLKILEDCLKNKEVGAYVRLAKVLLDTPILEGGISTEKINNVFEKYKDE